MDTIKQIVSKAKSTKRNLVGELYTSAYSQNFNEQGYGKRDQNFDKGRDTRNALISNEPQDHSTFNHLIKKDAG